MFDALHSIFGLRKFDLGLIMAADRESKHRSSRGATGIAHRKTSEKVIRLFPSPVLHNTVAIARTCAILLLELKREDFET